VPLAFALKDRVGDSGLVSVVILERIDEGMFVDTWLTSCRAIDRGLERFALDVVVESARAAGAPAIVGEYLPTPRNAVVKGHYAGLGFEPRGARWYLEVGGYLPRAQFITRAE
jgi:FkbH-like protein